MSHEALWQAANYLKSTGDPNELRGGEELGIFADLLLEKGLIQLSNGTEFKLPAMPEIGPLLYEEEFDYVRETGVFLSKDGERVNHLTKTERKVFGRLLVTPGVCVTREALASATMGCWDDHALNTLKTNIARIRAKMPVSDERKLKIIETKIGEGYRYNPGIKPQPKTDKD